MLDIPRAKGLALARTTAYHLYDPERRSKSYEMDFYLRGQRYEFVESLAEQIDVSPGQLLVDCLLADGFDAGVVVQTQNGKQFYANVKHRETQRIESTQLAESTRQRLHMTHLRATNMVDGIMDYVDLSAQKSIRCMQAAWRICEVSVEGETRRDGRPFSVHPLEATAILFDAIERVIEKGTKISEDEIIMLLTTSLLHDSVEDWVKERDHYQLDTTVPVVSPLVIKRTLFNAGLRGKGDGNTPADNKASYVANATRLMTHVKDQSWMQTYPEYENRLVSNWCAAIVKPGADQNHNKRVDDDPDPPQKPGQSDKEYAEKLENRELKRECAIRNIMEDRMATLPNPNNAYVHDTRAIRFGRQILWEIRSDIELPGERERFPHVDRTHSVDRDTYRVEILPKKVERLMEVFDLPETTLPRAA